MTVSKLELALQALAPLESYRSPLLPTMKFKRAALFGTITAKSADPGRPKPTLWYLTNPSATQILAFAETGLISPMSSLPKSRFHFDTLGEALHPRAAYAFLRNQQQAAANAFFGDGTIESELASGLLRAYGAAMPTVQLAWLQAVCDDYFTWLQDQIK